MGPAGGDIASETALKSSNPSIVALSIARHASTSGAPGPSGMAAAAAGESSNVSADRS
jgi:hypothetical protein